MDTWARFLKCYLMAFKKKVHNYHYGKLYNNQGIMQLRKCHGINYWVSGVNFEMITEEERWGVGFIVTQNEEATDKILLWRYIVLSASCIRVYLILSVTKLQRVTFL